MVLESPESDASDPKPLRILWVASELSWAGGIGRVLAGASEALAQRGHELHLAGRAPDGMLEPIPGVTLHPWPKPRLKLQLLPRLFALQNRIRADVVHFHAALAHGELIAPLARLRATVGSPRIFVTPHTAARTDYPKWRARLGVRAADAVLTPSRWSAHQAIAVGARKADTYEVYAGIKLPEPARFEQREPVVIALGRLVAVKGFDVLIDAFDRAARSRPGWRLQIGGQGRERAALEALIRGKQTRERIELLGQVDGAVKQAALDRASIGVVPSHRESFGGVLLEFESQGLACIATPVGGMEEITDEGRAALRVPPGDAGALTKALEQLMDDPALRRALGARGLEFARHLSWPATARRYESIYRRYLP